MATGLVLLPLAARKRSTSRSMPCSEGTPDSNAEAKPEQSAKPSGGSTSGSQEGYGTVDDGLARADSRDGEEPFERAIMAERSTSLARLHTEASHSKVKGMGAGLWGCGCSACQLASMPRRLPKWIRPTMAAVPRQLSCIKPD